MNEEEHREGEERHDLDAEEDAHAMYEAEGEEIDKEDLDSEL